MNINGSRIVRFNCLSDFDCIKLSRLSFKIKITGHMDIFLSIILYWRKTRYISICIKNS